MSDTKKAETKILEQKQERTERNSPTIRLNLTLTDPTEDHCCVFDIPSLIAKEKKKRRKEVKDVLNRSIDDSTDANDVKKLAKFYEKKYGGGSPSKKKKKPMFYNYTDLASGYDESDSFIDNTDYYDEEVPDEMEAYHGGYYVNCGQLEFKKADSECGSDDDDVITSTNKVRSRPHINLSDESGEDVPNNDHEASEDNEDEDAQVNTETELSSKVLDIEVTQLPSEQNGEINVAKNLGTPLESETNLYKYEGKERESAEPSGIVNNSRQGSPMKKIKKKRHFEDVQPCNGESKSRKKKKAVTVKLMLEEKRTNDVLSTIYKNHVLSIKRDKSRTAPRSNSTINDIIESVVKESRDIYDGNSSKDSSSSSADLKSSGSVSSCETDTHYTERESIDLGSNTSIASSVPSSSSVTKEYSSLPDNLSQDVRELVDRIKNLASSHNMDLGARSFFSSKINSKLLKLEIKTRPLSIGTRHSIYRNLAFHCPCSKETLMKRAKNLVVDEEESRIVEPFRKLKFGIDVMMPGLIERYTAECRQTAEEKNLGESVQNMNSKDLKHISSILPQKKFIWNDELRGYVRSIVSSRLRCFFYLKPRKESPQEYVAKFLSDKVKVLWPDGWMKTSILMDVAHFNTLLPKVKKHVLSPSKSTSVTSSSKKPYIVPNIVNNNKNVNTTQSTISSTAYHSVVNPSLSLQSLAPLQYSPALEKSLSYQTSSSSGIPYKNDLTIPNAVSSATSSIPADLLRLASLANVQYSTNHTYSKSASSTNLPKKQSPSVQQRQSTSTVFSSLQTLPSTLYDTTVTSSFDKIEPKKSPNGPISPRLNDNFKIDTLIAQHLKLKTKELHVPYSTSSSKHKKHYSSKIEDMAVSNKPSSATQCEQVLDLSPNKNIKTESIGHSEQNDETLKSNKYSSDHTYWVHKVKDEYSTFPQNSKIDRLTPSPSMSPSPKMERLVPSPMMSPSLKEPCNTKTTVTHISRKQRLLQDSALLAAQAVRTIQESPPVSKSISPIHCSPSFVINKMNDKSIKQTYESERKMMEETATATDILSQIINDTLQDNTTPLQPQFTKKFNFDKNYGQKEIVIEDFEAVLENRQVLNEKLKRQSPSFQQKPSINENIKCSDSAEITIKDIMVNSIPKMSLTEKHIQNFVSPNLYSINCMNKEINKAPKSVTPPYSQSSHHVAGTDTNSGIPRMNISGFQSEFFKHIYKMEQNKADPFTAALKKQECKNNDYNIMENGRTVMLNYHTGQPIQTTTGNLNMSPYHYQQSVIMPPANKPKMWHSHDTDSKL